MAKKAQKRWILTPPKEPKPKVPEDQKQLIQDKCNQLIESTLKAEYIQPPPTDNERNYCVDILGKWYRNYFYFCSIYNCPSPRALSPSFESRFARLEYVGQDSFNLAYMRHTGKWWEIGQELTLYQCLFEIETNPLFSL